MGTAIAKNGTVNALALRLQIEPDKLEFIRTKIASGTVNGQIVVAPDDELEYFVRYCLAKGLDPTAREVYFIPRKSYNGITWTIQTGIDGFRSMAERTGELDGIDEPEFRYSDGGAILSATVRVYRKGASHPFVAMAFYEEYVQTDRDGAPNSMWRKMKHSQLSKCAEALALRKAFPRQLGGTYTTDEMGQANNPEPRAVHAAPAEVPEQGASRTQSVRGKLAAQAAATESPASDSTALHTAPTDAVDATFTESQIDEKKMRADLRKAIATAWQSIDAGVRQRVLVQQYAVQGLPDLTTAQLTEFLENTPALIAQTQEGTPVHA